MKAAIVTIAIVVAFVLGIAFVNANHPPAYDPKTGFSPTPTQSHWVPPINTATLIPPTPVQPAQTADHCLLYDVNDGYIRCIGR